MNKACIALSIGSFVVASVEAAPAQAAPAPAADPAPAATPAPAGPADNAVASGAPSDSATTGTPGNAGNINNALTLFGTLGYAYSGAGTGFGIAARYQKTLADRVAISHHPTIHDDIGIEFGPGFSHYSFSYYNYNFSYNEVSLFVGIVWNFWLNDRLALYPKTEIGYRFGKVSGSDVFANSIDYGGLGFEGGAGVIYKLDAVALRAEVGNYDLRLGAALQF